MKNNVRSRILNFIRSVEGKSGITQMDISKGAEVSRQTAIKYIKEFVDSNVIIFDEKNKVFMKTKKPDAKKQKPEKRGIFPINPHRSMIPSSNMAKDGLHYIIDTMDEVLIEAGTIGYSLEYYTRMFQERYCEVYESDHTDKDVLILKTGYNVNDNIVGVINLIDYEMEVMIQIMDSTNSHSNYKLIDILYNEAISQGCTHLVCLILSDYRPNPYNIRYYRVIADSAVGDYKEND